MDGEAEWRLDEGNEVFITTEEETVLQSGDREMTMQREEWSAGAVILRRDEQEVFLGKRMSD